MIIAMARTGIALTIIISMEYYTRQTERSHNRKIQFMVDQSVNFHLMRWDLSSINEEDVERVLKRGRRSTHG